MKWHTYYSKALVIVTFLCAMTFRCSENPTGPAHDKTTSLEVCVRDENGNPYKNTYVNLFPGEYIKRTNRDGMAVFDNIKPGSYQALIDDIQLPYYSKNVSVKLYETNSLEFIIVEKVTVNVYLHDTDGEPITDVELTTVPGTQAIISDENGVAVLEKIPVAQYRFVVKRGEYTYITDSYKFVIRNGEVEDIVVVVPSLLPEVKVITPLPNAVLNGLEPVTFKGDGWDFEDVVLPEEAFAWTSSIDGELGTGRVLTIDHLSVGYHDITFQVTDSHGGIGSYTFTVGVINYQYDSWFPLAYRAAWIYRYLTPEFTLENEDGTVENWILQDLIVEMNQIDCRKSSLGYTITVSEDDSILYTRQYNHTVIDYFQSRANDLHLISSEEQINVKQYDPKRNLLRYAGYDLTTEYVPSYAILRNFNEPVSGDSYNETVTAQIVWNMALNDDAYYSESKAFEASCVVGAREFVDTDTGTYETIPITMKMGASTRMWWLAQGYGIVRLEYDMYGFPLAAVLKESTVDDVRNEYENGAGKMSSAQMQAGTMPVLTSPFKTPHDSPERIR